MPLSLAYLCLPTSRYFAIVVATLSYTLANTTVHNYLIQLKKEEIILQNFPKLDESSLAGSSILYI